MGAVESTTSAAADAGWCVAVHEALLHSERVRGLVQGGRISRGSSEMQFWRGILVGGLDGDQVSDSVPRGLDLQQRLGPSILSCACLSGAEAWLAHASLSASCFESIR